jgi:hypothetical protein
LKRSQNIINVQVFLKEHARGLYSSYTNYTVHSIPLYALAAFNGVMFVIPSWGMMNQDLNAGEHIYSLNNSYGNVYSVNLSLFFFFNGV